MFQRAQTQILSWIIYLFYRALVSTWRLKIVEPPELQEDLKNSRPVIFAHWHGDILSIVPFSKYYSIASIASVSKDGEIITLVLEKMGLKMARGSSSKKGALGLRSLLSLSKKGCTLSVPVDGPRGPRQDPKPGVFELSRILNGRIYPGGIAISSEFIFKKSWDKMRLPLPFASVTLLWGPPMEAISKEQDPRSASLALELKEKINGAGHQASETA